MKLVYKTILITLTLFLMSCSSANSQQILSNGKAYEVKGKAIFHDGQDITETLTIQERKDILNALDTKVKTQKRAELAQKRAEKALKKAERAQKKAEKELKEKVDAQKDFQKASKKLEDAQNKYDRLKRKGKLSPNDEEKWLEKIEDLREDVAKYKKRM